LPLLLFLCVSFVTVNCRPEFVKFSCISDFFYGWRGGRSQFFQSAFRKKKTLGNACVPTRRTAAAENICVWDPTHHNHAIYLIRSYPHLLHCVRAGAPRDEGATKLVDGAAGHGSLLPVCQQRGRTRGGEARRGHARGDGARRQHGFSLVCHSTRFPPRRDGGALGGGHGRRGRVQELADAAASRPGARELTGGMGSLRRGAGELLPPPRARAVELDPGRRGRGGALPASARAPRLAMRSYRRHASCPFCTASPRFRTAVSPSPTRSLHVCMLQADHIDVSKVSKKCCKCFMLTL
jgi:hypothetical protein